MTVMPFRFLVADECRTIAANTGCCVPLYWQTFTAVRMSVMVSRRSALVLLVLN